MFKYLDMNFMKALLRSACCFAHLSVPHTTPAAAFSSHHDLLGGLYDTHIQEKVQNTVTYSFIISTSISERTHTPGYVGLNIQVYRISSLNLNMHAFSAILNSQEVSQSTLDLVDSSPSSADHNQQRTTGSFNCK